MRNQISEIRLLVSTAIRTDPGRCLGALLEPVGAATVPLYGLLLGAFATAILHTDPGRLILIAAGLLGLIAIQYLAEWVGTSMRARLSEEVGFRFDQEITELTNRIPTITHLENPEYADNIELLRQGQGMLGQSLTSLAATTSAIVGALSTAVVLALVNPLVLLLVLFVLPAFATVSVQRRWEATAEGRSAEPARLARHLRDLSTSPQAGTELRAYQLQSEILRRAGDAWTRARRPVESSMFKAALIAAARAILFAAGFTATVGFVLWRASHGAAGTGDVITAVVVCQQVQGQVIGPAYSIAGLGRVLRNAGRLLWLRSYAEQSRTTGDLSCPGRLRNGITLTDVSFRYPGSNAWALHDVNIAIPAGTTVALLGENGAGKSTFVKLLARLYAPASGEVRIDDVPLDRIDMESWRSRLSAAFQDFTRPEFSLRHAVGLGDLRHRDEPTVIHRAITKAGADSVVETVPGGLDQQLGSTWPAGQDLSGGQWQRVALARGSMRSAPLVIFFDEPTSSMDALTEHQLFTRYLEQARDAAEKTGNITFLVTHRFSTVRSADLILVMSNGTIVESGDHEELMSVTGGLYRELYELQSRGYRT